MLEDHDVWSALADQWTDNYDPDAEIFMDAWLSWLLKAELIHTD